MNEREKFEAWWASNSDDNNNTKVAAMEAWEACTKQKDYEWNVVVKLKMDIIHAQQKEIAELKRGEYICKKCGLRKYSEPREADF